jgi:parallel beta-helix repeat protein
VGGDVNNGAITIDATALPGGITIDAQSRSRVISTFSDAVLNGLTITDGFLFGGGGAGIAVGGNSRTTVQNCTVSNNSVQGSLDDRGNEPEGGGIFDSGELTLLDSTVIGNTTSGSGGGIATSGTVGGTGTGPTTTLINSTIVENTADGFGGGGIDHGADRILKVINCTIADNSAPATSPWASGLGLGGGLAGDGPMYLQNTIIADNSAASSDKDVFNPTFDISAN